MAGAAIMLCNMQRQLEVLRQNFYSVMDLRRFYRRVTSVVHNSKGDIRCKFPVVGSAVVKEHNIEQSIKHTFDTA